MNTKVNKSVGSSYWCVIQSKPGKEVLAARQLLNQNFETYLPTLIKSVRRGRKYVTENRPLFPRYLFLRVGEGEGRWRSVNATYGVSSVVRFGDAPGRLPHGFVEALKERLSGAGEAVAAVSVGQHVRVVGGPFDDLCGEVLRVDKAARVTILLDLLTRQVPVTVPGASVIAAA